MFYEDIILVTWDRTQNVASGMRMSLRQKVKYLAAIIGIRKKVLGPT